MSQQSVLLEIVILMFLKEELARRVMSIERTVLQRSRKMINAFQICVRCAFTLLHIVISEVEGRVLEIEL